MSEMSTSGSGGTEQDPRYTEALALYLGGALTREQVFERYPGLRGRLEPLFADEDAVDGGVRNGPAGPAAPNSFSRYRILGRLGQGGMGVVLRAYDTELDREVALKVLRRDRAGQPEQIARMKKEACINARLTHSGIVPIHDAGVMPDGRPFITMKLVEGASLSELLEERKHKLDWHLKVFERICEAVAFAHSLAPPVLHRDLKPGNIRISSTGEVYTVD